MRRTRGLAGVGIAALVVAGTAAAATLGGAGRHATVDTLVLANAVKVDTLDPAQNSVNESIWLDQNIWSRLVQPNATGTKILPDLATSWTVSNGGKTYTFHMRKAQFSDGSPLTAQDAVFSVVRSKNLKGGWGFLLDAVTVTRPDGSRVTYFVDRSSDLPGDLARGRRVHVWLTMDPAGRRVVRTIRYE